MAHRRPTLRPGRVGRRLVCDLPGGDVGGDRGQFRIGPRRERLAYPRVKLVFGNPTMHKRGLEHVDYVLAVSMGRPEAAAGRRGYRHLVFRLCCHRRLPHHHGAAKPSAAALGWPAPQPRRPNGGAARLTPFTKPGTGDESFVVSATHIDYDVVMSKRAATPVRFDPPVADRLASFVAANPGMSLSSAANRLVDEALRMAEHPGIIFRSGPTGRRAALAGGPDVWEVIRAIKSAHAAEPGLNSDDLVNLVSNNTGIALRLVNTAVRYWAAYPSEVDAEIAAADAAEEAAEQAWLRERHLLAG